MEGGIEERYNLGEGRPGESRIERKIYEFEGS